MDLSVEGSGQPGRERVVFLISTEVCSSAST